MKQKQQKMIRIEYLLCFRHFVCINLFNVLAALLVDTIIYSISQTRTMRNRQVKLITNNHSVNKMKGKVLNSAESTFCSLLS